MKKTAVLTYLILAILIGGCSPLKLGTSTYNSPLTNELSTASKIVFINSKENTLKFTVADPKVIKQIAGVVGNNKVVERSPEVDSDYSITFYMPNGRTRVFSYWMGAAAYGKEVNMKDDQGKYYLISESLDVYIVSSTKMSYRPQYFVDLYTKSLSECISLLEKEKSGDTVVAVDITSDRAIRRYTMSYEDDRLLNGISADGYKIVPLALDTNHTYVVSYVTNMYNPDKARITVEAIKTADKTKKTFVVEAVLENNTWKISIPGLQKRNI